MMTNNDLYLLAPFAVAQYLANATGQSGAGIATSAPYAAESSAAMSPEKATRASLYSLERGVAVITIEGSLDRHTRYGFFTGARWATGYDEVAAAVNAAAVDPRVKAILLSIDSPGGVVSGCEELADRIARVAAVKPMAAYANGLCASAAFWLASATGRIFAPRTATVGSIGVVMVHADQSKAHEKAGVKITYLTGGKFKAVGNDSGPLSEEDREYMEARVRTLHGIFRSDVATHLGLDLTRAEDWGDGQVFVDSEAREMGLVSDTVSGLDEAVNRLALEVTMDKTQLAAQHPELWAELEKDTAHAVSLAETAAREEGAEAERKELLAIVGQLAGVDLAKKVEAVLAAGVMSGQLKAVMDICGGIKPAASARSVSAADDSRARILAGIEAATPAPLPGASVAGQANPDDSRAAIERMAAL